MFTIMAAVPATTPTCGTIMGSTLYDLSSLVGTTLVGKDSDMSHTFQFNPCGAVSTTGDCSWAMVSRTPGGGGNTCERVATWDQDMAQWEALHSTDGVKLTIRDGDTDKTGACDSPLAKAGVQISFICDDSAGAVTVIKGAVSHLSKTCLYIFQVKSPAACGGPAPPTTPPTASPPAPSGGGSGGAGSAAATKNALTVLFSVSIIVCALPIALVAFYVIGGILYNRIVHHATGVSLIPHYAEVWSRAPGLWRALLARAAASGGTDRSDELGGYAEFSAAEARPGAPAPLVAHSDDLDVL